MLEFIVQTNRPPVVGDAGGALYCDGGNSFAYDKDFAFGVPNTELQYSFEWWAYNWEQMLGGTWYHVAVTADAQDIFVFINGEFKKSSHKFHFKGNMLRGLCICHWPFWGPGAHYFHGFLDEFRIFNYSRSSAMIRETMHNKLRGNEVGLLAYYNFDDFRDSDAFAQLHANSDPIRDGTNSGRQLIPGGCTPNKQPWCPLGDGLCNALESSLHPCFDADGTTQVSGAQPVLYPSGAPVGGYGFPVVFNGTAQNSKIALPARGNDADALLLEVVSVPDAARVILTAKGSVVTVGTRLKASDKVNVTIVDPMFGGRPSTSFSYKAYDFVEWSAGVQKVDIHIQCPPDTHLDDANRRCVSCPTGTYNEEHSFTTTCSEYSNVLWASPIGGVITFVNSLAVLVTLVMAGVIVFFRKAKPIIASSPTFCLLIVIGALLGLADVYTYVGMPSHLSCALQPALVSLGFTLALGNLVLKTFRIHFIFNYARKARDVPWALKSSFLGMMMMFAIVIDLFILIA
ncbi:7 transmembrane sweet-taste receptor of 3 GCPR-domain-containing protein [Geranomyces variabilis]|nr:7 transmembrane sweet-taste receptor of 3 GCPR-domain-containing protein [Geranomyces variabilis]